MFAAVAAGDLAEPRRQVWRPPRDTTKGWMTSVSDNDCDGVNPRTGESCVLGDHKGYHRDSAGNEWLDD